MIYQSVWSRNQMEGHEEDDMKGSSEFKKEDSQVDPTDLRKAFAQFVKEKKISFNKQDEDKYGKRKIIYPVL